ncbi:MAG: helix-turn-helix domain-containing protein [Bdellovibrionales bacterium]|nr:helix-turn-helix domain-containing protein [Bdellovibrionales bacterium]
MNSENSLFDKLKWMTSNEAATFLRVSVGQIRNLVWRGQLKAYRLNNRLRFLRNDLERLLEPKN